MIAEARNWLSYGDGVALPASMPEWRRGLLCDPQMSGGLLVSVSADRAGDVLQRCIAAGFRQAAIVGTMEHGDARVTVS